MQNNGHNLLFGTVRMKQEKKRMLRSNGEEVMIYIVLCDFGNMFLRLVETWGSEFHTKLFSVFFSFWTVWQFWGNLAVDSFQPYK